MLYIWTALGLMAISEVYSSLTVPVDACRQVCVAASSSAPSFLLSFIPSLSPYDAYRAATWRFDTIRGFLEPATYCTYATQRPSNSRAA
jgi:hypothetical protein